MNKYQMRPTKHNKNIKVKPGQMIRLTNNKEWFTVRSVYVWGVLTYELVNEVPFSRIAEVK